MNLRVDAIKLRKKCPCNEDNKCHKDCNYYKESGCIISTLPFDWFINETKDNAKVDKEAIAICEGCDSLKCGNCYLASNVYDCPLNSQPFKWNI